MSEHAKRFADMLPDEEFEDGLSDWIHDFEVLSVENGATYGICYPESRTCRTYLAKHESTKDIINTTARHEPLHAVLADLFFYDDDEEIGMMDGEQEHKLIQKMSWVEDEKILDDAYISLYKGRHIKPRIRKAEYEKLMEKVNKLSDKLERCEETTPKEWEKIEKSWKI